MTGSPAELPLDPKAQAKSRQKLLLIFAIFFVPLLLATLWLQMVRTGGGSWGNTSRGTLIKPAVPLTEFSVPARGAAEPFDLAAARGLWTLLYLPVGDCLDVCQRNLYHMRQVRLALNHRMDRVQRVVVANTPEQLAADLLTEYPGMHVLDGDALQKAALTDQVRAAEAALPEISDGIYLIDPLGNLMMRFAADLPPKSMLKDIKHLLKVSRIG